MTMHYPNWLREQNFGQIRTFFFTNSPAVLAVSLLPELP